MPEKIMTIISQTVDSFKRLPAVKFVMKENFFRGICYCYSNGNLLCLKAFPFNSLKDLRTNRFKNRIIK